MAEPLDQEMQIAPVRTDRAARNHVNAGSAGAAWPMHDTSTGAALNSSTANLAVEGSTNPIIAVFWPILAILYVLGFTNLVLRSSFGVMAPDLAREMALSPAMLSMVASAFFFAYALMQVPTGMLLDRFGPRRTLATMLLFTTAGAAHACFQTIVLSR